MIDNKIKVVDINDTKELLTVATPGEGHGTDFSDEIKKGLAKQGFVEFTDEEIKTMPKHIKKLIIVQNKRCRLRTKQSGKETITYEIRLRREGYNISASGKTIDIAKANFIKKLKLAEPTTQADAYTFPATFNAFAMYYFENFRKEKVAKRTLESDMLRYRKYLLPHFGETKLKKITPSNCKQLLDKVKKEGKGKTADELHSLMNVIFKSAIAHGIIERNPLDVVLHLQHAKESGKALSKDAELRLKNGLQSSPYLSVFMVALYTGLRPNELKTIEIKDGFVIAQNSKRKNGKVEYKKIPITKSLAPYVEKEFIIPTPYTMREKLKEILPDHILYDLRTTFHTRCVEYGVDEIARKLFMGHSLGTLANAYTDVSDEYLKREASKLSEW